VNETTIQGWTKCPPSGGGWGNGAGKADYTVYFYAQFSKPLKKFGVWSADISPKWNRKLEDIGSQRYREVIAAAKVIEGCRGREGDHQGFYSEFPTAPGEQVLVKCGVSFASIDGAGGKHELGFGGRSASAGISCGSSSTECSSGFSRNERFGPIGVGM
jgi:hypothetical protein